MKINFEASGGLIHSSLVMQDFETDSYWAIMQGEAIAGKFKGTKLRELPGEKMRWKDWVTKHPNTEVLSIGGKEEGADTYKRYFSSKGGFRGEKAKDKRLQTKEPIFSFRYEGQSYAVPYSAIEGGEVYELGEIRLFFYRSKNAPLFASTTVFKSDSDFTRMDGEWVHSASGCKFDLEKEIFFGEGSCPERFNGFDTFWYNWSLSNPDTKLLQ